jgi:hypothetical protein
MGFVEFFEIYKMDMLVLQIKIFANIKIVKRINEKRIF